MRVNQPRIIAVIISLAIGFLAFLTFLFFNYALLNVFWAIATTAVIISVALYLLYLGVVEVYFNQNIKLIYRNIHRVKRSGKVLNKGRNTLAQAEEDVKEWAVEYRSELEELKKQEKFRREFIGNVSHELKTPIFNIQGYLLTLLDGGLDDPLVHKKYLTRANKSVDRMIDLLQDMDMLNRLESGVLELKVERFDLGELVTGLMDMLEDKAKKYGVDLIFDSAHQKKVFVEADAHKLEQVFINLIINAIKYNKTSGGEVVVSFHEIDQNILVEVADNGIGIPERDMPRIFERFYRVDKSRMRAKGGSGLGLSIVKHIIDQHQQIINVTSKEGEGTTFTFTLKVATDLS